MLEKKNHSVRTNCQSAKRREGKRKNGKYESKTKATRIDPDHQQSTLKEPAEENREGQRNPAINLGDL
jgi:hypothetical protein